ncbi:MAG TPA: DUF2306 domain-containing protein [Reyranella sp.]|nr:DUF2306 domain-containing protein [Reyranella sp.]
MSLQPILDAGPAVEVHIASIAGAFTIGTWMMLRPKGTPPHRALGRIYLLLMIVAALSSFGIQSLNKGQFSFLHLLSIFVLLSVPYGWWNARRGNVIAHRSTMIGLYVGGLWVPGILTLLPGRLLHTAVFGS